MIVKCLVTKRVWSCEQYQILGCVPIEKNENIILNSYGNFSVKDPTLILVEGNEYELELTETEYKGSKQYILKSIPSLMFESIDTISNEKELEILGNITTPTQAQNIHDAYPDFVKLILSGKQDKIDVSKIRNVGDVRFNIYVRELNEKYKYYHLMSEFKEYSLSLSDCKELCEAYNTIELCIKNLKNNPYTALIKVCKRGFKSVDKLIIAEHKEFKDNDERVEYLMLDVLNDNQFAGSTYMDANELGEYVNGYDSSLLSKLKSVAIDSINIYYDDEYKIIARMDTYLAECNIATFIKNKLSNNTKWDIDCSGYDEVDGFKLSDEQYKVLENVCEYDFSLLVGYSGTGKSSSMKSLIQMLEDNNKTYALLAPTGKASARLSETTGRTASTVHRYIGQYGTIDTDVLIVDEFSFFGTEWANMLINSITNPNMKILLVGDNAQLNPISHGKVFQDIIDSNKVPIIMLTKVFRYAEGGISKIATDIRLGKSYFENTNDKIQHYGKDYTFIESENIAEDLINEYCNLLNKGVKAEDITCISPFNVGEIGCYKLNNELQSIINPIKPNEPHFTHKIKRGNKEYVITLKKGDYVMNITNDYKAIPYEAYTEIEFEDGATLDDIPYFTSVFNGDCGTIVGCDKERLIVKFDQELIVYPKEKINQLVLAMVITCHKIQGSQNKHIINISAPEHQKMLTRNLLYVANTRATKQHIEIGSKSAVIKALPIEENKNRKTFLCTLLKEE